MVTTRVPDSADFHTYAVDWEPTITWYFDGIEIEPRPTAMDIAQPLVYPCQPGGRWQLAVESRCNRAVSWGSSHRLDPCLPANELTRHFS
jgi:hypothetical protein